MIDNDAIFNVGLEEQSAEKLFKDEEDIIIGDINEWFNDSTNLLFIVGLSGSGKTTQAMDLFVRKRNNGNPKIKQNDIKYVSLDILYDINKVRIIPKVEMKQVFGSAVCSFFYDSTTGRTLLSTDKLDEAEFYSFIDNLIDYIIKYPKKESVIIEGVQIFDYIFSYDQAKKKETFNETRMKALLKYPIIIKGSSVTTSVKQALQRYVEKTGKVTPIQRIKEIFRLLKMNVKYDKQKHVILKNI